MEAAEIVPIRRIGIDIGGVIIDRVNDNTDTSFFGDNWLATTAVPGAFEAIARLVQEFGAENLFLVSKCGLKIEQRSMQWLDHHDFWRLTGMLRDNVRFCRKRAGKLPIAQELGLTHFVDDRLEILIYMDGVVEHLFLFKPQEAEIAKHNQTHDPLDFIVSWSWPEQLAKITRDEKFIVVLGIISHLYGNMEALMTGFYDSRLSKESIDTLIAQYRDEIADYERLISGFEVPMSSEALKARARQFRKSLEPLY